MIEAQQAVRRNVRPLGTAIRMVRPSAIRQYRPVMVMHRPQSATSMASPYSNLRPPSSLSTGASPLQQRTIIVQKASQNETPQRQKKMVVISQASAQKEGNQYIQVQPILRQITKIYFA